MIFVASLVAMENNPVKILRPLMEAGIPESLRSSDWNQRWNEWEAYCDAPSEIKQNAANGKPMVEEIRRAFENGNLRAEECLSLINQQFATPDATPLAAQPRLLPKRP